MHMDHDQHYGYVSVILSSDKTSTIHVRHHLKLPVKSKFLTISIQ